MTRLRINRSLEEELARKADDFRVEPSQGLWESVASQLPAKKPFPFKKALLGSSVAAIAVLSFLLPSMQKEKQILAEEASSNTEFVPGNSSSGDSYSEMNESRVQSVIGSSDSKTAVHTSTQEANLIAAWQPLGELEGIKAKIDYPQDRISPSTPIAFVSELPSKPELKKRNWFNRDALHLVVSSSLDQSYRNMTAKNDISAEVVNRRESSDRMLTGYRVGADLRYYITNSFSMSLGFHYGSWGENLGITYGLHTPYYDSLGRAKGHNPNEMYRPGSTHRYNNQYRYLEIPFMVFTEKPLGANFSLGAGVGLSAVYNDARSCLNFDYQMSHYVKDPASFRKWNSNLMASLQLRFQGSEKLSIMGGPSIKYGFLSTFQDSYPVDQHQYAISWNIGLQWKLFQAKTVRKLQ